MGGIVIGADGKTAWINNLGGDQNKTSLKTEATTVESQGAQSAFEQERYINIDTVIK